jgi:hypothetical protein
MSKTQISREQLTEKVLAAVRQHPGCEGVKEVAVSPVEVLDRETTWHVNVIDEGDAKMEVAYNAAKAVHDELVTRFELDEQAATKS